MPTETLRDKLAFGMFLADHEAENLPGPGRNLGELETAWNAMRTNPDVSELTDSYLKLADRMITYWNRAATGGRSPTT